MKIIKFIPLVFIAFFLASCENESIDSQFQNEEINNKKNEESLSAKRDCNPFDLRESVRYQITVTNANNRKNTINVPRTSVLVRGENTSIDIRLREVFGSNFLQSGVKKIEFKSIGRLPVNAALISQPSIFKGDVTPVLFDVEEIEVLKNRRFSLTTEVPRNFKRRDISLFYQFLFSCR